MAAFTASHAAKTIEPSGVNDCLARIRKDFRCAKLHCDTTGHYARTITPVSTLIRTNKSSAVRADFSPEPLCDNDKHLRTLYREVGEEPEFSGVSVSFTYEKAFSCYVGDRRVPVINMLTVLFDVSPEARTERMLFKRRVRAAT